MSAVDEVLEKNRSFAEAYRDRDAPRPPRRHLAIVSCMDSRLNIYEMLGLEEGHAHVIRNAGGIVTDDVIRSSIISQRVGGTREVMIIHNTECGMLTFRDGDLAEEVARESGHEPPFAFGAFGDLDGQVRRDVERVRTDPFLAHRNDVRGFVYEVRTGRLREVR